MRIVEIQRFGGPEVLQVTERPDPVPSAGEVVVRLTSIGLNHAELMGRRGEYKLSTGDPPTVLGLEGGGIIDAVGDGVTNVKPGDRVTLTPGATRVGEGGSGGTYRSHYLCPTDDVMPAPDAIPDDQLGALWLPYLTAWGCFHWLHRLHEKPADQRTVAVPAASSSVGLAAAQVVKLLGGTAIGLTSSPAKVEQLKQMASAKFDHLIVTHDADRNLLPFHRDLAGLTDRRGINVFFDPVASGPYLSTEIKSLATNGTVYVYGLLGDPDTVDVSPLIRKNASIRGWVMTELREAGEDATRLACETILKGFADGMFHQQLGGVYALDDVQRAHEEMEQGQHVGKLVLVP